VICVVGDGGLRPYLAELPLALEEQLPLLVVLMTDGRYGTVAAGAPELAEHRAVWVGHTWWQAVEALGCPAQPVIDPDDLIGIVARWRPADGPLFLEAGFDAEAYVRMTERLR